MMGRYACDTPVITMGVFLCPLCGSMHYKEDFYMHNTNETNTIANYLKPGHQLYIVVENDYIRERFLEDAKAEGFTIIESDSEKKKNFYIVNEDMTVREPQDYMEDHYFERPLVAPKTPIRIDYATGRIWQPPKGLTQGSSTIVVSCEYHKLYDEFGSWLKENGFHMVERGSWPVGIDWVFVNLNNKMYRGGKIGVGFCEEFGGHAVTPEEFKIIYNIFQKYAGKKMLDM